MYFFKVAEPERLLNLITRHKLRAKPARRRSHIQTVCNLRFLYSSHTLHLQIGIETDPHAQVHPTI